MRNDLPNDKASNFSSRVRETLMTYLGKQGDPLDRGLTLRDLVENGFVSWAGGKTGSGAVPLTPGTAITDSLGVLDLTPPPSPTGFTASAGIATFVAQHDSPTYPQGGGHLRTRLYGKIRSQDDPAPVFADAVEIAQFTGAIYAHATNPTTTWHLWAKWETKAGVLSASPAGGTNGVVITTGEDVSLLLTALSDQITSSQLYSALRDRIDLIDGPSTLAGSVAARLAAEAADRATAITDAVTPLSNALIQEISDRASAIVAEASDRTSSINSAVITLQSQIDAISAASSGDVGSLIAVINAEQQTRKSADEAFAGQTSLLVTLNAGNAAAIKNEETARSTADSATAGSLSLLYAASGANQAAILNEANARISEAGAFASQLGAIKATSDYGVAGLVVERTVSSTETAAVANQVTSLSANLGLTNAAINQEQTVRADADSASAALSSGLAAAIASSAAALTTETIARATGDLAITSSLSTLTASVGANTSAVQQEATARVTDAAATSSQITGLAAVFGSSVSAISNEAVARASADSATASALTSLNVAFGGSAAGLTQERTISAAENSALAATINSLVAASGANAAAIISEASARATDSLAVSSLLTTIQSTVNNNFGTLSAAIASEASTRAGMDGAISQSITQLSASFKATQLGLPLDQWVLNGQSIVTISDGKVGDKALRLAASPGGYPNQGTFVPIDRTKKYRARFWARPSSNANGLLYFSLQQFLDTNGSAGPVNSGRSPYNPGAIDRATHNEIYGTDAWGEYTHIWDANDWQAGVKFVRPEFLNNYAGSTGYWEIQDFSFTDATEIENNTLALQTEATVRANADNSLFAQYTVKIDAAGRVSGFGLASESSAAGANTSAFGINADRFWVSAPANFSQESQPASTSGNNGKVWYKPSTKQTFRYDSTAGTWVAFEPIIPFVVQTTPTTINGVTVPAGVYMDAAFIRDGTITNAKIGNAAIDDAKISSLDAAKITTGYLSADRIESESITADKIDTKNLTIKDDDNNVIFGSGTKLSWDLVSGQPSNIFNSNISIASNGALTGGGGGQVTISGLGYTGDLNATRNAINYATAELWAASSTNANGAGKYGSNFLANGESNQRVWASDPFSRPALIWRSVNNDTSSGPPYDADGGWDKDVSALSANKSYVSFVFFRRNSAATSGNFYHGCSQSKTLDMSGGANSNPYFVAVGGLGGFTQGDWYLSYGVIHANNSSADSNSGVGGIYHLKTGRRIHAGTDFKMSADATEQVHRTYLYYSVDPAVVMEWWSPGFYEINGLEPSLSELLSFGAMQAVSPTNPINTGNVSTYIANAAIGNAQIGNRIQSTNFNGAIDEFGAVTNVGSAGWAIDKTGVAVFNNVRVRGDVEATSLNAATGTFSGTLNSVNGVFTGTLQGASGTFSGELLAGTLDLSKLVGTTLTYSSPGTYYATVPAGSTKMRVQIIGAGGGGASSGQSYDEGSAVGPGGGGGGVSVATYDVVAGNTYSVAVGAGGAGGAGRSANGNGNSGSPGGNSQIVGPGVNLVAYGGKGATAPTYRGQGAVAGAGGAGTTANGFAGTLDTGQNEIGIDPKSNQPYTYYNKTAGGKGGNSGLNSAVGGAGGTFSVPPAAGGTPGAGGGGSWTGRNNGGAYAGGNGGNGRVVVEFYNPNGVVIRSEWSTLISALQRQGIQTT